MFKIQGSSGAGDKRPADPLSLCLSLSTPFRSISLQNLWLRSLVRLAGEHREVRREQRLGLEERTEFAD